MAAYELTNKNIIKGGHLMVMLEGQPIAFATSHSLSKTLNTQEVSTKDHGDFSAVLPQNITWEITTENLYSLSGYNTLNNVFNSMTEIEIYFGETSYDQENVQESIVGADPAKENWVRLGYGEEGKAYITSLQVTAGAGDNATFSATFTGNGSLTAGEYGEEHNITATGVRANQYTIPQTARAGEKVLLEANTLNETYIYTTVNGVTGPVYYTGDSVTRAFTMPNADVILHFDNKTPAYEIAEAYVPNIGKTGDVWLSNAYVNENNESTGISQLSYLTADGWTLTSSNTNLIEIGSDGLSLLSYSTAYTYAYVEGETGAGSSYSDILATYNTNSSESTGVITPYLISNTKLKQYLYRH